MEIQRKLFSTFTEVQIFVKNIDKEKLYSIQYVSGKYVVFYWGES